MSWNTDELFDELDNAGFAVDSIANDGKLIDIEFLLEEPDPDTGKSFASLKFLPETALTSIKYMLSESGCKVDPVTEALHDAPFDDEPDSFDDLPCHAGPSSVGRKDDGVSDGVPKPMFRLMPPLAEEEVAKVLTHGAVKYGEWNWREVDDAQDRYLDAALRHINARRQGKPFDADSGLHAIAHAICSLYFYLELELEAEDYSSALKWEWDGEAL